MEEMEDIIPEEEEIVEETQSYTRPAWQRIGAIIAAIVMLLGFLVYCYHIANGGI